MARTSTGSGPGHPPVGREERGGGVPDGLLIGGLAFLLGVTVLLWTATGLAGLFAHGAWPADVSLPRTPSALRRLASSPTDLAGAWPSTPPGELSGYGLFWGLLISELLVLVVLGVFVLGVVTRGREVRRRAREERRDRGELQAQQAQQAQQEGRPRQTRREDGERDERPAAPPMATAPLRSQPTPPPAAAPSRVP